MSRFGKALLWFSLLAVPCFAVAQQCVHPCIYLSPTKVTQLRAKAAAGDADWLALKAQADAYLTYTTDAFAVTGCATNHICYDYAGFGWLSAWQTLGVAYQVTGNAAYAAKGIEVMNAVNAVLPSLAPESSDSGYASRSAAFGLALAFDWFYDQLTSSQKTDTINTLNAWFNWMQTTAYQRGGPAYGNYFGGHLLGFGVAGYATAGDNPTSPTMINWALSAWNGVVAPGFSNGGFAGGYEPESYNYGVGHFIRLFQFAEAVTTATGSDLPNIADYSRTGAKALVYNVKPNLWQISDEGDWSGDTTGILYNVLPVFLSDLLAGTAEGAWMQWLYQNSGVSPSPSTQAVDKFSRLMYYDASRSATDYRATLPTCYHSIGDEHLWARGDWTQAGVWASLWAGTQHWADHQSEAAGHLAIQRGGDYLLINAGQWKGPTGVLGQPEAFSLYPWRGNILFLDDLGEYMYVAEPYTGGQGVWGTNALLASECGTDYGFIRGDLTSAYDHYPGAQDPTKRSMRSMIRSSVFLAPAYTVVFDRVQVLKDYYIKKWFWHLNPATVPVVSGNTFSTTVGGTTLVGSVLLPAIPSITIEHDGLASYTDTNWLTYRAVTADTAVSTSLTGLHVFSAIPSRGAVAPPTSLITSTGATMYGALIADPSTPRIAMFSADGTAQNGVTYAAPYSASLAGSHLVCDLTPGTQFSVLRDGAAITAGTSSSQGCLEFTSTGGTTFQLTPSSALPPLAVTTTSLPGGMAGASYSATLAASGGAGGYTWSVTAGALPAGLALGAGTGVISGTPTAAGTANFTVQVSDANSNTASQALSITVNPALSISTVSLASGMVGAPYSATLAASGGAGGYTWSVAAGTLPAGLALAVSTGVISGTPIAAGTANFTVQVSDANSATVSKTLSITVNPALSVTNSSLASGMVGAPYKATLSASGGAGGYTWSITAGTLPAGLALGASSGAISGTPTASGTASFTVQVSDASSATASKTLSVTVNPALFVATSSLASGMVGAPYNSALSASGGAGGYTWSVTAGTLPAGLALAASTGVISGTPAAAGTANFTVQVGDANSNTASQALTIAVSPTLVVNTTSLPSGTVSKFYSATLSAGGGAGGYTWSVTAGALPSGLTLTGSTGAISGTPTAAGTFSFTVQVRDSNGYTASKPLSITINPKGRKR